MMFSGGGSINKRRKRKKNFFKGVDAHIFGVKRERYIWRREKAKGKRMWSFVVREVENI
jgi:hypothetical protein